MKPKELEQQIMGVVRTMIETSRLETVAVSDDKAGEEGLGPHIGQFYAIITPGPLFFGRLRAVTLTDYYLDEAAWIADTGRLHEFIKNPQAAKEAEHVGSMQVPRAAVLGMIDTPTAKEGVKTTNSNR